MVQSLEKLVLGAVTLVSLSGCRDLPYGDTGNEAYVVLYPGSPSMEEDLHCRVDGAEENSFDYHWLVNRETVFAEARVGASLLSQEYILSGDYVECSAWSPASSLYDSFNIGVDGVYVE